MAGYVIISIVITIASLVTTPIYIAIMTSFDCSTATGYNEKEPLRSTNWDKTCIDAQNQLINNAIVTGIVIPILVIVGIPSLKVIGEYFQGI